MITAEDSRRLDRLQQEWPRVFGEALAFGFDISWGDLDLLERCVEKRSKRELNKVLKERHADGRMY